MEFPMIPVLAAVSAISTIDKLANGVISQLKQIASPTHANTKPGASDSFATLLAAHGVYK
jgi:hypothetical protein